MNLEMLAFIAVTVLLLFVVTLVLLVKLGFYTTLETGNIKYINHGETLWKIIADVPGKIVSGQNKLVNGNFNKNWLNERFGLYWVGIPGIASVESFKIQKKKELEITKGKPPVEWIHDSGSVEVDSLRATFPRPFLLMDVELGNRVQVTLLVVAMFEVVDAFIPVPRLKGDFFGNTGSTLKSAVDDILKGFMSIDDFILATKGEGGILKVLENSTLNGKVVISEFNKKLEQQVGLHLIGASIPDYEASDKEIQKAMNQKSIAKMNADAVVETALGHAKDVEIRSTADAEARKRLAKARGVEVQQTVTRLKLRGSDPTVVSRAAADILTMEAVAGTQLTTLVTDATKAVVPVGGSGQPTKEKN